MPETILQIAVWLLALSFAWAASAKVVQLGEWRSALEGYGFSGAVRSVLVGAVPAVETLVVILLLIGRTRIGAVLVIALLGVFSLAVLDARSERGNRLPCGCFGGKQERDYRVLLLRNTGLAAVAALVLIGRYGDRTLPMELPKGGEAWAAALAVTGLVLIAWMIRQVVVSTRQRGRS